MPSPFKSPADATDAEQWLRMGRTAMQAKAPAEAERFFRRAVELQPALASARVQYGLNLLVLDRCEPAIAELSEATRLDPTDPDAFAHLAYCEAKLNRAASAREHANAALSLDSNHPLARQLAAALR